MKQNGRSRCVIPTCGKKITWRFWLCSDCEEKYGRRKNDENRPKWVTFLVNEAARQRRAYDRDKENEISFEDLINSNGNQPFSNPITIIGELEDVETYAGIMPDSDWAAWR